MYKKKLIVLMAGILLICSTLPGCSSKNDNGGDGIFNNSSELQNAKWLNGWNALYDRHHKYFCSNEIYYQLDENGRLTVNCKDASCLHESLNCDAYVGDGCYFVFNGRVYRQYNENRYTDTDMISYGHIIDVADNTEVFNNPVPDGLDRELAMDDSTGIFYVRVLNDDYIKVEGHRHAYLLDQDFHIKYWYSDVGKFPWGMVYENHYYYVNDLFQLVKVDLNTNTSEVLDMGEKVFAGDNDSQNIYYSDQSGNLYKYSMAEEACVKIAEDAMLFSVQDEYIYCSGKNVKKILTKDGKEIAEYTDYENMGTDSILQINDKVYSCFEGGVAEMDLDGKNYREYILQ